jgi:glyoxylase-like metal-dependent hydrolase (beta-lactamase superfamily II)
VSDPHLAEPFDRGLPGLGVEAPVEAADAHPGGRGQISEREDLVGVPVVQAGLATLWEDRYVIDRNLTPEAAPGHTPGSSVLRLRSGGDRALFVGPVGSGPARRGGKPTCPAYRRADHATR